jgi:hypothetical protein
VNSVRRAALFLVLISAHAPAEEAARPIAVVRSGKSIMVDGEAMPPSGSAAYPVVEHDEIATQGPTLLTTNNRSVAVLDANTRVKIDILAPPAGTSPAGISAAGDGKLFYIFLRQGGLSFDAKGGRMYICAGGRLVVPEARAKGAVRTEGVNIVLSLTSGSFAEQGKRGCTDAGIAGLITSAAGAAGAAGTAGAAVAPIAGAAIAPIATSAGISAVAVGAGAVGLGLGATAGASAFTSTQLSPCATAGCNTLPATVSPSQP